MALIWTVIGLLIIATITVVDRVPYQQMSFYAEMNHRLDSLQGAFRLTPDQDPLELGWAKVNMTPAQAVPLAGYGARDPKRMEGVQDSGYVRTVIFKKGKHKAAFITADLLIIHPEISRRVYEGLPPDWHADQLFFSATHTHSGIGSWAPGLVGRLFSGRYDPEMVEFLSSRILKSLEAAGQQLRPGGLAYGDLVVDELVRNRVSPEGRVDSALRMLVLQRDSAMGILNFYSAHATCLSDDFHLLSGDYPGALNQKLDADSALQFAAFGAGAMGSMGLKTPGKTALDCTDFMAEKLYEQVKLFLLLTNNATHDPSWIRSFRLKLPLRQPRFKITKNLALRPSLFHQAFGSYEHHLSVLVLGKILLIGVPGDFSGELALPLYQKARDMGYQLVITSFNGDYMGYIIRDKWYDLPGYEARTMSWYGPDAGSYVSEVISRILDTVNEAGTLKKERKSPLP